MNIIESTLPGVLLLEPKVFGDARGFFLESWNRETFAELGLDLDFVQDDHSRALPEAAHALATAGFDVVSLANNHALDGGRASSAMEKEAVGESARMFGWENSLGHLTGGGTMANLEALWLSGHLHPGRLVVASSQAHYTHSRLSQVLQLPFTRVNAMARVAWPCSTERSWRTCGLVPSPRRKSLNVSSSGLGSSAGSGLAKSRS